MNLFPLYRFSHNIICIANACVNFNLQFLLETLQSFNFYFSGYLLSKEEGQPGTPEKPLSDLGRVSYYAYWNSVVLEYLHKHRTEKIKLTDISKETGMYCHDVATALQLLNFIKYVPSETGPKLVLSVKWDKVQTHMDKVAKSKTRIPIDTECLRWTPLLTPTVNPFREDNSDNEKDASLTETADIVVPLPEKIIIETQQGVKMKKGRKRKISTTPKTTRTPKTAAAATLLENGNSTTEEQEIIVTSSGRRRTRPSKYNETTFVDIRPKSFEPKRKRNETSDKEIEPDKKKAKTVVQETPKAVSQQNDLASIPVKETENITTPQNKNKEKVINKSQNTRSKRSAQNKEKLNQRWSQRRAKIANSQTSESEKTKETPDVIPPPEKPVEDTPEKVDNPPTNQITETPIPAGKPKTPRVINRPKKGWFRGRKRSHTPNKKQITLVDFIQANTRRESESESLISEKSDEEAKVEKPDVKTKKDIKVEEKKRSIVSCDEDSSAEADDEMENDEIVNVKKPTTSPTAKYKYVNTLSPEKTEKPEMQREKLDVEKNSETTENNTTEIVVQSEREIPAKTGTDMTNNAIPLSSESTSSESEMEIDGQKIKTISQKEVMDMTKQHKEVLQEQPTPKEIEVEEQKQNTDSDVQEVVAEVTPPEDTQTEVKEIEKIEDEKLQEPNDKQDTEVPTEQQKEVLPEPEQQTINDPTPPQPEAMALESKEEKPITITSSIDLTGDSPSAEKPNEHPENEATVIKTSETTALNLQTSTPTVTLPESPNTSKNNEEKETAPAPPNETICLIKTPVTSNVDVKETPRKTEEIVKVDKPKAEDKPPMMEQKPTPHICHLNPIDVANASKLDSHALSQKHELHADYKYDHKLKKDHEPKVENQPPVLYNDYQTTNRTYMDYQKMQPKTEETTYASHHQIEKEAFKPKLESSSPTEEKNKLKGNDNKATKIKEHKSCNDVKYNDTRDTVKPKEEIKIQPKLESPPKPEKHKVDKYESEKRYLKTDDKNYENKPKIGHLENEALLHKPEYTMNSPNYHVQAHQYSQWSSGWDRIPWEKSLYQPYPMPIHIPPIEVLSKHQEKEKTPMKPHRHEQRHSHQPTKKESKSSENREKASPRKEDKPIKSKDLDISHQRIETNTRIVENSKIAYSNSNELHKCQNSAPPMQEKLIKSSSKCDGETVESKQEVNEQNQPSTPSASSVKHTPPTPSAPDIPSMGVYTPDSTTNSVHSLHCGPIDIDVSHLGLESPTSISSDMTSQNSVPEPVRPPSVVPSHSQTNTNIPQTNYDCTVQHMQTTIHTQSQQSINIPASSPNVPVQMPPISQHQQQQSQQQQSQQSQSSSKRQMQQQRNRSNTPSKNHSNMRSTPPSAHHNNVQQRQRSTPPVQTQQHNQPIPTTQHQQVNTLPQQHPSSQQFQAHLQHQVAMQSYGHHHQLSASPMHQHPHHHPHPHSVISQGNYIPVPQMAVSSQAFTAQGGNTYVSVPAMTTVIQHRMNTPQSAVSALGSLSAHQKLVHSPACAVTTGNLYIQANSHPHSHTPGPITTPTPAPTPTLQANTSGQGRPGNSSCSLAKLQQLTNELEMIPPSSCNTMTPPPAANMTLTPPPSHHSHPTMTPPPSHQIIQNQSVRNLTTPPSGIPANLQSQVLGYQKYYQPHMNMNQLGGAVTPPIGQNLARSGRNSANVTVQHMQTTSSRVSPNVTLNPNIMAQYNTLNGYRMAAQQTPGAVTGYITNTAAGFINNTQIPMQMGVMNMAQTQYQDQAAIQRAAAQQNSMYTTYGYINGSSIMQPMRR